MEAIKKEIDLGAVLCRRLKNLYFKDEPWIKVYRSEVPSLLTKLKAFMRNSYPGEENISLLNRLIDFSDEDLKDLL